MIILGAALLLGAGGLAAYGAIGNHIEGAGPVAGRIIAGCIAVFFLGLGALFLTSLPAATRSRSFVIDAEGIRYQDRKPRSWACSWSELDQVRVETAHRQTRSGSVARGRLIMKPTDPGFGQRHPSMSRFAGHYGAKPGEYGMPLGPDESITDQLDSAIRGTGVRCYAGLIDTGMIIGFGGYA